MTDLLAENQMLVICPGWGDPPLHAPEVLSTKPGRGESHGACGECRMEMKSQERVRIQADIDGRLLVYECDRLGAALRLRFAKTLPGFRGYKKEAIR